MHSFASRGLVAAGMTAALLTPTTAGIESTVDIDGGSAGAVFDGIGAQSSGGTSRLLYDYPEPQRGQILDYLFTPNYGASLQHLKVEIGGDGNASNGSEASHQHTRGASDLDVGYEWWLMKEARKRNPHITFSALEWGVPGWVGGGDYFSADNLDYIVSFLKGAKEKHGLTIDYVGTVNEPRILSFRNPPTVQCVPVPTISRARYDHLAHPATQRYQHVRMRDPGAYHLLATMVRVADYWGWRWFWSGPVSTGSAKTSSLSWALRCPRNSPGRRFGCG